jgi:hypothetical protein
MTKVSKSRRDIYQTQNGRPVYAQEIYIVEDLPNTGVFGPEDVLAAARGVTGSPVPGNGEARYGIPIRYIRVDELPESGKQRRIIAAWGRRNAIFPDATAQRFEMAGEERVVQPYAYIATGGEPPASVFETRRRVVYRGRYRVLQGKIIDSGSDMQGITITAASNINKLYRLNGNPGIPVLLKGVSYQPLRQGGIWIWTIFEGTGWVRAQEQDEIEDGSLPVEELPPLAEYRETPDFATGTAVRPALKEGNNDGVYENGSPLTWL